MLFINTGTCRSSASSALNSDHPVGAAVSALLSLSDHTNSRSPSHFTTACPLPRMSYSPLRSSHQVAHIFTATTSSEGSSITPCITSASNSVSSPPATITAPASTAGGMIHVYTCTSSSTQSSDAPVIITNTSNNQTSTDRTVLHGTAAERSGPVVTQSRTVWEEMAYVQVMAVPDAVRCSEDLTEGSETMRLTQEQTVPLLKVDGPSLIGVDSNVNNDVIDLTDFTCEASVESNISHDRSSSSVGDTRTSLHSTPSTSPRRQRSFGERSNTASNNEIDLQYRQPISITIDTHSPTEGSTAMSMGVSSAAGEGESWGNQATEASPGDDGGSPRKRQRKAAKPGRKTTPRRRTANSKRKS